MAPELAIAAMRGLPLGSRILDPMAGSGTVLRQGAFAGHSCIGFDRDPLAVLISRTSSSRVDVDAVLDLYDVIEARVSELRLDDVVLPWIDNSEETRAFVAYWFGVRQRNALRKLAYALWEIECGASLAERRRLDFLRVALSRIIVTKEIGASLARDVSHSRPHKVCDCSEYDVFEGFRQSVEQVIRFLDDGMPERGASVNCGDARRMNRIEDRSIDLVVTSPPYLNAIDYLRGHKLSLVWLGYGVEQLRSIRSDSIGSERGLCEAPDDVVTQVQQAMLPQPGLPERFRRMVTRYAVDVLEIVGEISRVMAKAGRAVFVVGDSCLRSVFISNSDGVAAAAEAHGLRLLTHHTRELPLQSRYLPLTSETPLSKRMRFENVLTFAHA
jgi:hypothetical protein